MGRYITGDINRKLWFAVQSSDAASRFGGQMYEPQYIEYVFEREHLKEVQQEMKRIKTILGDKLQKIEDFFKNCNGYRDEDLEAIGISRDDLREYADLELGRDIEECIIKNGSCNFQAEL